MPMLAPAAEQATTVELPYVAAEFGELSASETARLIAKSVAFPLSLPEWMVLEVESRRTWPTHRSSFSFLRMWVRQLRGMLSVGSMDAWKCAVQILLLTRGLKGSLQPG